MLILKFGPIYLPDQTHSWKTCLKHKHVSLCVKILLENKNFPGENVPLAVSCLFFSCRNRSEYRTHSVTGPWLARGADSVWWHWWKQGELSGCSLCSHTDETRSILLYEMGTVSAVQWALLSIAKEACGDLVILVVVPLSVCSICTWKCVSAGLALRLHLCSAGSLGSELH